MSCKNYISQANEKWHVMNQPTSEAWFDPWYIYLEDKGVKFLMNSEKLISVKHNRASQTFQKIRGILQKTFTKIF